MPYLQEVIRQSLRENTESPIPPRKQIRSLAEGLDKIIDDRGQVRDTASAELQHIRRQLIAEQARLRRTLDSMLRTAQQQGWVPEGATLTVRNGRMVIPIVAEHKRKIRGFVQDESDSGKTVFLEPADALEANNTIRELESAHRREIVRLLTSLTDTLRPHLGLLRQGYQLLGILDSIRAKARYAADIDARPPRLEHRPLLRWQQARHPLLLLSHRRQGRGVVPLNVSLEPEARILVVSGPNAGGKSVLLKTIGLLQYCLQCGLPIPVGEGSTFGIFRNIFLDMGDEQSIENDLSTYSSHLTSMKQFLLHADRKTLFLIDEFGTGTEPSLGGAIAESILEELARSGAFGVVNTHYSNLKTFADRTEGLLNGAMRFDAAHLQPLYELEAGKPGSSFAFEIGHKIGLPGQVLEAARRRLDRHQVNFEKLSRELEIEKKVFQEKNSENLRKQQQLDQSIEQYRSLKDYLDAEKKRLLTDARQQARDLVQAANARIEQTIREIREQGAEKLATKEIRQQLSDFVTRELPRPEPPAAAPVPLKKETPELPLQGPPEPGDAVRVLSSGALGEVLELRGKDAIVAIGDLRTTVKISRLQKVSRRELREATGTDRPRPSMLGVDLNEKALNFSFNLDLRGSRGDEALLRVDQFMNDALLLGYPELRIVHGKGDGILRQLIRSHLQKRYPQVSRLEDEHADRGGAGVTIVHL